MDSRGPEIKQLATGWLADAAMKFDFLGTFAHPFKKPFYIHSII